MERICSVLMSIGLLVGVSQGARAELGSVDTVPAATLLLPYFEVGLDPDFTDLDTRIGVRNASPAPIIAHFTVYTDVGVPTLFFDVSLTGYDDYRLSLRDLFDGQTVSLGVDTAVETPAPQEADSALFQDNFESGDLSRWSVVESRISLQGLAAYHTGQQNTRTGMYAGSDQGDGVARGYMTIDNVLVLDAGFPTEDGYFVSGGMGVASNDNVLTGEFELVDVANNSAIGNPMVHVEAGASANVTTAGKYTFYGAYVNGTAADNREPLSSTWRNRYIGGIFNDTSFIYWHDLKFANTPSSTAIAQFDVGHGGITIFDEEENFVERPYVAGFLPSPIPLVCGRATAGAEGYNAPFEFGWIVTNLNGVEGLFGSLTQGYILSQISIEGRFSVGSPGVSSSNLIGLP